MSGVLTAYGRTLRDGNPGSENTFPFWATIPTVYKLKVGGVAEQRRPVLSERNSTTRTNAAMKKGIYGF